MKTELGTGYWSMSGADSGGVVSAKSTLALELLDKFQDYAEKRGTVAFPDVAKDFTVGKLDNALGAFPVEIEWVGS